MNLKLVCPWKRTFFGLTPSDKILVYESIFLLIYHLKMSWSEAYKLPLPIKKWLIDRFVEEKERESEEIKNANKK